MSTSGKRKLGAKDGTDNMKPIVATSVRRIAIDSNTFRNLGFINFLQQHKEHVQVHLPSIVHLEVGYYFMSKGISWDGFKLQVEHVGGVVLPWNLIDQKVVLEAAIANKGTLAFKQHFRDFIIGMQCMAAGMPLVTYNTQHFQWCKGISILTPEEFASELHA
ncbi:MAG: type II toxin-antitoxin system VapC family toxin [Candidatus Lokiarchaeota archaeon]|nr:type II toxin-antitoxin system VapC family toxin [Candidatus Lokiarchaeota archaeon]